MKTRPAIFGGHDAMPGYQKYTYYNFDIEECPLCAQNAKRSDCQLAVSPYNPRKNSGIRCHNAKNLKDLKFPEWVSSTLKPTSGGWSGLYSIYDLSDDLLSSLLEISTEQKSGSHLSSGIGFQKAKKRNEVLLPTLSTADRDAGIRLMAEMAPLHHLTALHEDLLARGLTPEQIVKHCFVAPMHVQGPLCLSQGAFFAGFEQDDAPSISKVIDFYWPGARDAFMRTSRNLNCKDNYFFIPAYNFDGLIHGGQLGLLPQFRGTTYLDKKTGKEVARGKYIHLKDINGHRSTTPEFNEHPITLLKATKRCNVVLICEGLLKPIVAYERLGGICHVMGAIGGNFAGSRENYLANLTLLRDIEGVDTVLYAVDKNWADEKKTNVHSGVAKALHIADSMGFAASVFDFGQGFGSAEDIDMAPVAHILENLAKFTTTEISELEQIVLGSILPSPKVLECGIEETIDLHTILDAKLSYESTEHKVVFDLRPMGAGKSHIVPSINPAGDGGRVFYVTQSPRMAPTKEIHETFVQMPSRHGGLVHQQGRVNAVGDPLYLRPKAADHPDTFVGATCAIPEQHVAAAKLGVHGSTVCKTCEFASSCRSGDGQYSYIRDKATAMGAKKIITAIDALNPAALTENDTVIIDEVVQSVPFVEKTTFKLLHVKHYIQQMNANFVGLNLSLETSGRISHSLTAESVLSAAFALDARLAARIEAQLRNGRVVDVIPARAEAFVRAVLRPTSSVAIEFDMINVEHLTDKVSNIVRAAGKVVLLDATSSPTVLAAQYSLNSSQCFAFTQPDKGVENMRVTVLRTEGLNSRQGSHARETIGKAARKVLKGIYGADNIGFATHREYAEKEDVIFFSDSRGSNRLMEKKALGVVGLPLPNLGAAQTEHRMLAASLPNISFDQYYNYKAHAELKQTLGRLRGFRRAGEDLHAYVVANVKLTQLEAEGYNVDYKYADWWLSCISNTNSQKTLASISALIEEIKKSAGDSLAAICKNIAIKKSSMERTLARIGVTFETLVKACTSHIPPGNWAKSFPEAIVQAAKQCVETGEVLDLDQFESEDVLEAATILSAGQWPSGAKKADVVKIREAFAIVAGSKNTQTWANRLMSRVLPGISHFCHMRSLPNGSPLTLLADKFIDRERMPNTLFLDIIDWLNDPFSFELNGTDHPIPLHVDSRR